MTPTLRPINRHTYDAVGICIYCRRSDIPLTLEHIIPESLGGSLELPQSSCKYCQIIINEYEWTLGRKIFGDFRIKYNMSSKRPKNRRPKEINVVVEDKNGGTKRITVSRADYPAPTCLYSFGVAKILLGLPPGTTIADTKPLILNDKDELIEFNRKHGNLILHLTFRPDVLARSIAKIAYSFCVAELGIDGFKPSQHTLDAILNKTDDYTYVVGDERVEQPALAGVGHKLSLEYISQINYSMLPANMISILVKVRLLALSSGTPEYHVIVGHLDLKNPHHVRSLDHKPKYRVDVETP